MTYTSVDDYLAAAPAETKALAAEVRELIKRTAPEAEEKMSYGMPYYGYKGRLIYWAAYPTYVGLYVMAASRELLAEAIKPYQTSKATLHFKVGEKLPKKLITDLVKAQLAANKAKP